MDAATSTGTKATRCNKLFRFIGPLRKSGRRAAYCSSPHQRLPLQPLRTRDNQPGLPRVPASPASRGSRPALAAVAGSPLYLTAATRAHGGQVLNLKPHTKQSSRSQPPRPSQMQRAPIPRTRRHEPLSPRALITRTWGPRKDRAPVQKRLVTRVCSASSARKTALPEQLELNNPTHTEAWRHHPHPGPPSDIALPSIPGGAPRA